MDASSINLLALIVGWVYEIAVAIPAWAAAHVWSAPVGITAGIGLILAGAVVWLRVRKLYRDHKRTARLYGGRRIPDQPTAVEDGGARREAA